MTSIYLIRHGQASFGQPNYDCLSDLGEAQAKRLGEALVPRLPAIAEIYCGTMLRHRQTATHCLAASSATQLDIETDAHWNEYDHQALLAALSPEFATPAGVEAYIRTQPNPRAAFETLFKKAAKRWMDGEHENDYPESFGQFENRVAAAFERVTDSRAKTVLVFTSGGPISLIAQRLLGIPSKKLIHLNWTLVNCGITKVVKTRERLFVSSLNEHSHLETNDENMITYK